MNRFTKLAVSQTCYTKHRGSFCWEMRLSSNSSSLPSRRKALDCFTLYLSATAAGKFNIWQERTPEIPRYIYCSLLESELIWGWILQRYWVVNFILCCFMSKLRLLVTFPYPSLGLKMWSNMPLTSEAASLLCRCCAACKLTSAHRNRFGNFLTL